MQHPLFSSSFAALYAASFADRFLLSTCQAFQIRRSDGAIEMSTTSEVKKGPRTQIKKVFRCMGFAATSAVFVPLMYIFFWTFLKFRSRAHEMQFNGVKAEQLAERKALAPVPLRKHHEKRRHNLLPIPENTPQHNKSKFRSFLRALTQTSKHAVEPMDYDQPQCAFLNLLPPEIRLQIYQYVLSGNAWHIIPLPYRLGHAPCVNLSPEHLNTLDKDDPCNWLHWHGDVENRWMPRIFERLSDEDRIERRNLKGESVAGLLRCCRKT
jgi:hypothetical protein